MIHCDAIQDQLLYVFAQKCCSDLNEMDHCLECKHCYIATLAINLSHVFICNLIATLGVYGEEAYRCFLSAPSVYAYHPRWQIKPSGIAE